MANKLITLDRLTQYDTKIKSVISEKANSSHSHNVVTTTSNGFMSSTDKTNLNNLLSKYHFKLVNQGEVEGSGSILSVNYTFPSGSLPVVIYSFKETSSGYIRSAIVPLFSSGVFCATGITYSYNGGYPEILLKHASGKVSDNNINKAISWRRIMIFELGQ